MTMTDIRPSLSPDERAAFETWVGNTDSVVVLVTRGEYAIEKDLRVEGRKKFQITPADRRMNQDRIADPRFDPFLNGTLAPVSLVEGEWDNDLLRSNPNVLTEEEMKSLLKERNPQKFAERLETVDNEATLRRLLEIAYEVDASVSRVAALQKALTENAPIATVKTQKYDPNSPGGAGPVPVAD